MSSATPSTTLTPFETITLEDAGTHANVVIAPGRGGMVTRFDAGDPARPVMFMDATTLADPTKNVRGGNPVLFPSPGPLAAERFTRHGRSGSMKQHGFARQRAWNVVASSSHECTLELTSDDATRAAYPWDFVARIRYSLESNAARTTVSVATTIENRSDVAMPFALGFHPYFFVPDADKKNARIPTDAKRAWDNFGKNTIDLIGPIDLTVKEVDLHLFDHTPHSATLDRGTDRIIVSGDPEFSRWVIWTQAGKDFVCLEPWTAPADALNTGEGLIELAKGASKTLTMKIAVER